MSSIPIIVWHQARARCFLNRCASLATIVQKTDQANIKFKNLSVFRFNFKPQSNQSYILTVNEIYDGDVETQNRFSNKFTFTEDVAKQFFPRLESMTFYTVRHGRGEHNAIKGWRKFVSPTLDPLLVEEDTRINQCWNAIQKSYTSNDDPILMWYSSPLRRAIQTCARLMYHYNSYTKYTITILPYLIELPKAVKNGLCDDALVNRALNSLGNSENRSTCLSDTNRCKTIGQIFQNQNRRGSRLSSTDDKRKQQQLRKLTAKQNSNIVVDWDLINNKPYPSKLFTYYLQPPNRLKRGQSQRR